MTQSPTDRPRLVVAADGLLAAIGDPARIVIADLPSGQPLSEIVLDRDAESDFAWVGTPPRLLVLARHATHTAVHLLDPHGPQSLAEIELASAVALFAAVGAHALVIGAQGAAVLTASESHLTPYQFPARARPTVAGAASNQFVVAIPGVIEEWDPQARVPKRRLRLPRQTTLTAVGGSERVVWMIAQQEPARIDVLPLINRGQPKTHDLPEPIAAISGHPKSDLLACVGAESGRAYVIDLDGRTRLRALSFPDIDHVEAIGLVIGRTTGVVAIQRGRPLAFAPLETRDPHVGSIVVPTRTIPDDDPPALVEDLEPIEELAPPQRTKLESPFSEPPKVILSAARPPSAPRTDASHGIADANADADADAVPAPSPPARTAKNLAARFAAVRERREAALGEVGVTSASTTPPAPAPSPPVPTHTASVSATAPTPPVPTHMPPASATAPTPPVPTHMPSATAPSLPVPTHTASASASATAPTPPVPTHTASASATAPSPPVPTHMPPALATAPTPPVPTHMPPVSATAPTPPVPTHMPPVSATAPPQGSAPAAPGSVASVLQAAASLARQFMPGTSTAAAPVPDIQPRTARSWRDACVAWARELVDCRAAPTAPPDVASIHELVTRFELSAELVPALALLYGAHLDGHDGIAPAALAHVLDIADERRWAEALGRGELAASGVAVYERSRVRLAPAVQRVLDELPPATGTLVGAPAYIALLGACVIVERDANAIDIARRHAARAGGAILVGHDDREPAQVCFEARAIGASAMLPARRFDGDTTAAVIYVADHESDADRLGLPRFA